jgi:hypothetical protein
MFSVIIGCIDFADFYELLNFYEFGFECNIFIFL